MPDVKSDKTFEEIVERLAALFKLKTRPGDRDYEETIEIDSTLNECHSEDPSASSKRKK